MELAWGLLFGVVTALAGHVAGFDRDRSFYPTMMVVVALVYVLFACMAVPPSPVWHELLAASLFIAVAILGFRASLWFVVAALVGHGLFDLVHNHAISNPAVPLWWPGFCGSIDLVLGAVLSALLRRGRLQARRQVPDRVAGGRRDAVVPTDF